MTAAPHRHPNRPRHPIRLDTMGGRICHWRIQRGLTQDQLGRAAEVGKSFISLIEDERSVPSVFTIKLIADALQVRLDYLIAGRGRARR